MIYHQTEASLYYFFFSFSFGKMSNKFKNIKLCTQVFKKDIHLIFGLPLDT